MKTLIVGRVPLNDRMTLRDVDELRERLTDYGSLVIDLQERQATFSVAVITDDTRGNPRDEQMIAHGYQLALRAEELQREITSMELNVHFTEPRILANEEEA